MTVEVLAEIETQLRSRHRRPDLVLADHFDYFAGTSTGAILAAGLALGWSTDRLRSLYVDYGQQMFKRLTLRKMLAVMFRNLYPASHITRVMQKEYGGDTPFGSDQFRSLFMAVLHNTTSSSPWPLSNNPHAKYNQASRSDSNMRLPLWKVVRASTAAPFAYPPETVSLTPGDEPLVFADGGVTPYNNPAFQLYLQATLPEYKLEWTTGVDKMLLVSVGTGLSIPNNAGLRAKELDVVQAARIYLPTMMAGNTVHHDLTCRAVGHCVAGDPIDGELGDLVSSADPAKKQFTYARYNADLSVDGLERLGLDDLAKPKQLKKLAKMDRVKSLPDLQRLGRAVARQVDIDDFAAFTDSGYSAS